MGCQPYHDTLGWHCLLGCVYRLYRPASQSAVPARVASAGGGASQRARGADIEDVSQVPGGRAVRWNFFGGSQQEQPEAMTDKELELRDRAEAVVLRGLKAADAVKEAGRALNTLKARDLWRDTHDSWAEYVVQRFHISSRRAHQLIEFSQFADAVADVIGTTGTDVALTERALRPLADVSPDEVQAVIAEAVAASGGAEPTPAAIRVAVANRKKPKKKAARTEKPRTFRVAGAKVIITPTLPAPAFRGFRETLVAALAKLDADSQGDHADAA